MILFEMYSRLKQDHWHILYYSLIIRPVLNILNDLPHDLLNYLNTILFPRDFSWNGMKLYEMNVCMMIHN